MDVSTDPRVQEAWAAAAQSVSLGPPSSRLWRRLLAELDPSEVVLHLDVLTDRSRDVCVVVTSDRLLSWTLLTDRFRRMPRGRIRVIEHRRTVDGVLRLSDGSSPTPMRLKGRPEQRSVLLRALRLPAGSRPLGPVVLDLTTSPKTKAAYAASPLPPPATGPDADAVLGSLGSAKAQLLVRATLVSVHPAPPGGDVIVVGSGTNLRFVPVGASSALAHTVGRGLLEVGRGLLKWEHRGSELTLFYDQHIRSNVGVLRGDPAALAAVVDLISRWAVDDAASERQRSAQQQVRRVTGSDVTPAVPVVRRSGFFGRKRAAPITTWKDAEAAACAWLHNMGFRDAKVTPSGPDVGIDVTARKIVAQVKWEAAPVGRPKLQQLHGAASQARKKGAFFSRSNGLNKRASRRSSSLTTERSHLQRPRPRS